MNSIKRLILLTAAVMAVAAPAASARVADETPTGSNRPATVQKSDYGTIALHHDQITQQQWERAAAQPELPLVDGTPDTDGGPFPTGLLLVLAIGVPLGIVLTQVVGKAAVRYRRGHRLA
jgi:hypothetical protein